MSKSDVGDEPAPKREGLSWLSAGAAALPLVALGGLGALQIRHENRRDQAIAAQLDRNVEEQEQRRVRRDLFNAGMSAHTHRLGLLANSATPHSAGQRDRGRQRQTALFNNRRDWRWRADHDVDL